jgi:hypothetical protein
MPTKHITKAASSIIFIVLSSCSLVIRCAQGTADFIIQPRHFTSWRRFLNGRFSAPMQAGLATEHLLHWDPLHVLAAVRQHRDSTFGGIAMRS